MVQISVTRRDGEVLTLDATPGYSLMETIRDAGDLMALCGGVCSCATCHVYIDEQFEDCLPNRSADEDELLAGSNHRRETSRLSCQIPVTEAMHGLEVTVAPED